MIYKLAIDKTSKKVSLMAINNENLPVLTIPFEELIKVLEKHNYSVVRKMKEPSY